MPPKLRARIGRDAVQWLAAQSLEVRGEFLARLHQVCADELTLIRETRWSILVSRASVTFKDASTSQTEYLAVVEWNHTERSVRVHECYKLDPPPQAA